MKFPFFGKRKKSPPPESDKLREELHEKLDATHDKLNKVLVKLREVRKVAVNEPARLRVVKP